MKRRWMFYTTLCLMLTMTACGKDTDLEQESHSEISVSEESNISDEAEETGIDLYGTYDQNDCRIVSLEEDYNGVTIELPQIEGLKDVELQNKLNQEIQSKITEAYSQYENLNYLNYQEMANFSNVLSLAIYMGAGEEYQQIYLNYNLVNGDVLKLENLFKKDADLLGVIRNAFYEMLVQNMMFEADEQNIVSPDENRLYKIVKSYSSDPDKTFMFSPANICLYYKDSVAVVDMADYADEIVIYSKYLTEESIYADDSIGKKGIFTCMNLPTDVFEVFDFGYLEENLWFDVTLWQEYIGDGLGEERAAAYADYRKSYVEHIYKELEAYRQEAKENPEQFYIYRAKPLLSLESDSYFDGEFWVEEYKDTARTNKNVTLIEMPYDVYENTYKDLLIQAYRSEYLALAGGVELPLDVEGIAVTELYEERVYDYTSGVFTE